MRAILVIMVIMVILMILTVTIPGTLFARGSRESSRETVQGGGDVTILNGETLAVGSELRARGRIGVYGNEPFTYPALRTEIAATLLESDTVPPPVGGDPVVPLLLELTGMDPEELDRRQDGPVLVTGVIRRMPQGPRQGLLEVISIESP